MKIASMTHIGMVRQLNEDSFCTFHAGEFDVLVVADGMGGHNAGEVASKLATEIIEKYITENVGKEDVASLLKNSVNTANEEIFKKSKESSKLVEMGTTVVICLVKKNIAFFLNVGDSRGYIMDKFGIKQITEDDSVVAQLLRNGEITEEEAKRHPQRNVITQAVGTEGIIEPHIVRHVCKAGDVVLVCTDGLTNMVSDDAIFEAIKRFGVENGTKVLIEFANDQGGKDNITLIAGEIDGGEMK